jgi:hypothetical protein
MPTPINAFFANIADGGRAIVLLYREVVETKKHAAGEGETARCGGGVCVLVFS